VSFEEHPNLAA